MLHRRSSSPWSDLHDLVLVLFWRHLCLKRIMRTYTAIGIFAHWELSMKLFDATIMSPVQSWDFRVAYNRGFLSDERRTLTRWALLEPEIHQLLAADILLYNYGVFVFKDQTSKALGVVWRTADDQDLHALHYWQWRCTSCLYNPLLCVPATYSVRPPAFSIGLPKWEARVLRLQPLRTPGGTTCVAFWNWRNRLYWPRSFRRVVSLTLERGSCYCMTCETYPTFPILFNC